MLMKEMRGLRKRAQEMGERERASAKMREKERENVRINACCDKTRALPACANVNGCTSKIEIEVLSHRTCAGRTPSSMRAHCQKALPPRSCYIQADQYTPSSISVHSPCSFLSAMLTFAGWTRVILAFGLLLFESLACDRKSHRHVSFPSQRRTN
jgi:hypothetical protein